MTNRLYSEAVEKNMIMERAWSDQVEKLVHEKNALMDRVKWLEYKLREATGRPVEYLFENGQAYKGLNEPGVSFQNGDMIDTLLDCRKKLNSDCGAV